MNTEHGEPVENVLRAVHERYPDLDMERFQKGPFKQWRDRGLFSRPIQRPGRGKSHGKGAIYPPGTTVQVLRILEMRAEGGRFNPERARWRLWWEGFDVEPAYIWTQLDTELQALDAWRESWRALTPDECIERTTLPSHLPEPLRTIRKRVGPRGVQAVSDVLVRVNLGEFTTWEHREDRSTVINGLGLDRAKRDRVGRAEPWLRGTLDSHLHDLAKTIQSDRLRDALTTTKDSELSHARDELQALIGLIHTVRLTAESMLGAGALGLSFVPHPNDLNHSVIPSVLLGWLAFRRDPMLSTGYETLMRFAESGAPRSFFINLTRNANTQEPPRRLAPSGSVAHGEEPSTCTTSLSPPQKSSFREAASLS